MTAPSRARQVSYSVSGAAAATDLSEKTISRAIHSGRLRAKKVGRIFSIPAQELQRWHDNLPDAD